MKTLLITLSLLFALTAFTQTYTNGVYVRNGKTVEVDKKVHQFTTSELLHFSNELIVKTETNADFTVNGFFQEVNDLDKPAHFATFGDGSLSTTLMAGNATVVYSGTNENATCVISTPLVDLELYRGVFYFKVTESRVIVFVLEGSLKSHGEKRKENTVTAGYAVVAQPNDIGILEDKVSIGAEKVKPDMVKKLSDDAQSVVRTKSSVRFIAVDGKVVGLNIN